VSEIIVSEVRVTGMVLKTATPGFYMFVRIKAIQKYKGIARFCSCDKEEVTRFVRETVEANFRNLPRAVVDRVTNEVSSTLLREMTEELCNP